MLVIVLEKPFILTFSCLRQELFLIRVYPHAFRCFRSKVALKSLFFPETFKKNLVYSCPFTYTRPFPIRKMTNCMVSVKAFAEEEIHEGVEIVKRPAGLASVPKVQEKRQERKKKKCTIN